MTDPAPGWLETRLGAGALSAEVCLSVWNLAEQLQRPAEFGSLVEACVRCASREFELISVCDEWTSLDSSQLSTLFASEEIDAHEVDVFQALMRWARARKPAEAELGDLLQLVRFNSIPAEALGEVCEVDPVFAAHPDFRELLFSAFKYHALPAAKRPKLSERRGQARTWNPDDKHAWVKLSDDLLEVSYVGGCEDGH